MKMTSSDGASGAQRTDYAKTSNEQGASKEIASKPMPMIKAGGKSGSGVTGSSASYPKGSKVSMTHDFNPQKGKASTYGIDGI